MNDLLKLDSKKDAVRLAHVIGRRKRELIINKAIQEGFKILNAGELLKKDVKEE